MRAISVGVLGVLCFAAAAPADPPAAPVGAATSVPVPVPVPVQSPPGPAELAPLSPDFQAAMANSQLQTYRYNQLTEQATALKKLCDTGFGPAEICPAVSRSTAAEAAAGAGELPTVVQIDGGKAGFSAILLLGDGRRLTVRPGSLLPGGLTVAAISPDDVRLRTERDGQATLPFGDRGSLK
jgi:type IV pilus biogenesis protein PilP